MQKLEKIKYAAIAAVFLLVIFGFSIAGIFYKAPNPLQSERRTPASFPEFSFDSVKSASFMDGLEDYLIDNFPLREEFRVVKAAALFNVFRQSDNNGVYESDGYLSKLELSYEDRMVALAGQKFERLRSGFLSELNVYLAIIPDKNYFLASTKGYPSYDYDGFVTLLRERTPNLRYIDIFDTLRLEDFYKTDLHWDQSRISAVIDRLSSGMGFERADTDYVAHTLDNFKGSFAGQLAYPVELDTLTYLTSRTLDAAKVYVLNDKTGEYAPRPMYDEANFGHVDPYDIFLDGPTTIIKIVNEKCESGRHLVLFRDSFGSSAAPLMVDGYSEIYVVDLRYASSSLLETFTDVRPGDDALFLYSTTVLIKNAATFKVY